VAQDKIVVSYVPALTHICHDDDVFACHVSDARPDRAWDVFGPHGPETLQLHPMRAHECGVGGADRGSLIKIYDS